MTHTRRWLSRPVLAWALYDVATSTYAAIVPPFFGLYFVSVVMGDVPGATGRWGLVAALALALAGVLAPLVGAYADRRERWLSALWWSTSLCMLPTLLMPLAGHAELRLAAVLFIAAQVGYTLATANYDSLLLRVAAPTHVGRVSGFGWALGFSGGILALLVALSIMHGVPAAAQPMRLADAFLAAGLLGIALGIFALLGLRRLRNEHLRNRLVGIAAHRTLGGVLETLRHWRRHREAFRFLLAFYLINDVLVTILLFVAIVVRARFGLTIEGLLWLALLYHVLAAPATLVLGTLADHVGQKPMLYAMSAVLGVAILLMAFGRHSLVPVVVVVLLSLVYGSLQAVCRSLFSLLIPADQAGELFGFNAVAGRLSAATGPLVFGIASAAFGSDDWALCLLLVPLVVGVTVLLYVQVPLSNAASHGLMHSLSVNRR
ncbi:MAG TPA: MFS transporter [Burkholderiaceae bacterium]|nr:MFS transporter [Burkholderiaceae bacterium]